MKKIAIIGHVDYGKTTLTEAIKSVLDKERVIVHDDSKKEEKAYEYTNPYHLLNQSNPSKTRLKKCQKGLHEYSETQPIKVNENFFKTEWNCIHCGISMNRL